MDRTLNTKVSELQKKRLKALRSSLFTAVAFLFITVIFFSAQTYAYFTSNKQSDNNIIATGKLDVELIEMRDTGAGQEAYVNNVDITPSDKVSKIVTVKNAGTLPVYIRIKIEKSINKQADALPANWEELITCDFKLDDPSTTAIEGAWTLRDGYFYYNVAVQPGHTTSPLFENVTFSNDMGNEFTNSEISLKIICEAAQTSTGTGPMESSVGWPATP